MSVIPLSKLTNWTLKDRDTDIRGLPLFDEGGRHLGNIEELLIETDTGRIEAVRNATGNCFSTRLLEIFSSGVIVRESASPSPITNAADWTSARPRRPASDDSQSVASSPTFHELRRARIEAVDGRIGSIEDIYFDDHCWTVRYLVVDTSKWLFGRKVLIPSAALMRFNRHAGSIHLNRTREQIRHSPSWDGQPPVSRQHEAVSKYHDGWGAVTVPTSPARGALLMAGPPYLATPDEHPCWHLTRARERCDERLRSMNEVCGYIVELADAPIGKVRDFMLRSNGASVLSLLVYRMGGGAADALVLPMSAVAMIDWSTAKVRLVSGATALDGCRIGGRA